MSRTNSKLKSQKIHAKRRALERYGISLTETDYDELVHTISGSNASAIHIIKQSNTRSVFLIPHHRFGKLLVCYDKQRGTINTFLPKDLISKVEANINDKSSLMEIFDMEDEFWVENKFWYDQ